MQFALEPAKGGVKMSSLKDEIKRIKEEILTLKREIISLYYLEYFDEDIEEMSSSIKKLLIDLEASRSKNDK